MTTLETPARCFADLLVWQKAHRLVLEIYRVSERFPSHELYGLTAQVRRAAVSVPANIVEGFKKRGNLTRRDTSTSRRLRSRRRDTIYGLPET